jgi:hypothetical protein
VPSPADLTQLHFLREALFELLLLGVTGGVLGAWVVLRRLAFFTHAVGTVAFPGLVVAGPWGIAPQLAALEALVNPSVAELLAVAAQTANGTLEVLPPEAPLVLFIWSRSRVVPVRVTEFSITEEAFDQLLNPIRAKVELGLRTLTEKELKSAGHPFDTLALVNLIAKEVLARSQAVSSVAEIAGSAHFSFGI